MHLTAHLEPAEEGGFTARINEIPGVISEGDDKEQALANLMDALATYLAWKSTRDLHAGHAHPVGKNALELEIA
jgi:predicted RNase H-like HicB family nuclease